MKYKIPDEFMGGSVKGAIERALAKTNLEGSSGNNSANSSDVPDISGFVYVPSIGLYVGKEKELHGNNWENCKSGLHGRGDRMPTPYEFVEFMKHLREKDDDEARRILDEIYTVRDSWRSEYLDAKFEIRDGIRRMHYFIFTDSCIEEKSVDLNDVLMEDRKPGIDLTSWINDSYQGLPKQDVGQGDIWYWHPRNGNVVRFYASSDVAILSCNRDPGGFDASLGVRAVRRDARNSGGIK
jgi:hypothetical protein